MAIILTDGFLTGDRDSVMIEAADTKAAGIGERLNPPTLQFATTHFVHFLLNSP